MRILQGPCAVNDVELPDGRRLRGHGVKVERCRVLEESGCASVCVNSCKVPTQVLDQGAAELTRVVLQTSRSRVSAIARNDRISHRADEACNVAFRRPWTCVPDISMQQHAGHS